MTIDLHKIEFVRATLSLDFEDPFVLTVEHLLRLRRNLHQAARRSGLLSASAFDALFDSPVSVDPYARRRYQRPGPPFIIHPPENLPLPAPILGTLELPVVLFGRGIRLLEDFCSAFHELGKQGLHLGEHIFNLVSVDALDLGGNRMRVWPGGVGFSPLPVIPGAWFLETFADASRVSLQIQTPARLLSNGRPLFQPNFTQLFPFIMRRVTSMIHAQCEVDLIDDPGWFIEAAGRVAELGNDLAWQDWRCLVGGRQCQDLGGVAGSLILGGDGLGEILWLLQLGSLLNIGKGAAFGAGHFCLHDLSR